MSHCFPTSQLDLRGRYKRLLGYRTTKRFIEEATVDEKSGRLTLPNRPGSVAEYAPGKCTVVSAVPDPFPDTVTCKQLG